MKKTRFSAFFSLVLAVILMVSLIGVQVSAAAPSPTAQKAETTKTSPLPKILLGDDGKLDKMDPDNKLVAIEDAKELSADEQKDFSAARKALPNAVPKGFTARYFFFSHMTKPYDLTIELANCKEAKVMKYVNNEWVEMESKLDVAASTLTIFEMPNAPMAILTK